MSRKILSILVNRANYGRMRSVLRAIDEHRDLDLSILCTGSMVLERFGYTAQEVKNDGFRVDSEIFMELEGSNPLSMTKSLGFGIVEISSEIKRINPDIVLLIGDRYECLAAAIASVYQNIPVAHIQGGEISGSIDESARHAITKLAHWHFPSTQRAADYIVQMGEAEDRVFNVGCPVGDYILNLDNSIPEDTFLYGSGAAISPIEDFVLVIYHPVTTEFGEGKNQVRELFDALEHIGKPTVFLWPNIDAGADHISKVLRVLREQRKSDDWLFFAKNFEPVTYQKLLKNCVMAVGNSSSFVRDTTFSGTPVVLVGRRQEGRECGRNVIKVSEYRDEIIAAMEKQIEHGRYEPENLYGNGNAGEQIAEELSRVEMFVQKRLDYIYREG